MERFSRRDNVLLGYSPQVQRSFDNSMETSDANSEMDFSDVFGGPPRRFSIQENRNRYSFSETRMESDEDTVFSRNPWSGLDEKPVFGEEIVNRKSCPSGDFYDDIFKGDEAKSRRTSRDFFASSPGSRILSPSRPLPVPKAEPFSTSFPAQFRFANQATEVHGETRKDRPLNRQSPLSHEVSHTSDESSYKTNSNEKDMGAKLKNNPQSNEVPLNTGQFHFSIYKWAGSGVPLLMPLGGRSKSRYKERFKTERSSSSNGRIESDGIFGRHLPTVEEHIISVDTESEALKINNGKHEERNNEKMMDSCSHVEETYLKSLEPNLFESEGHAAKHGGTISRKKTEDEFLSNNETHVYPINERESSINKGQSSKIELKLLHELLNDENEGQGNATEGNENNGLASKNANINTSPKKYRANSNRSEVTNAKNSSATNSADAIGRSRAKGKVKEFVKIFNQESTAQPKTEFESKSSRWKGMGINGTENGMSTAVKTDEKVHKVNKNKMPEASIREDDSFNKNKMKRESHFKSSFHKPSGPSMNENNASPFYDSLPNYYENKVENEDDSFHGFFLVEELTHVEDKDSQNNGVSTDIQASNAKIQQWSNGRQGNIRSLLSTLQFVLWPESGWKPVPLIDLIEGSAVKRAYQRALLCLHPDKLQQKGAASHQKYIAEQVFDILQEAWDHFNSLGAI